MCFPFKPVRNFCLACLKSAMAIAGWIKILQHRFRHVFQRVCFRAWPVIALLFVASMIVLTRRPDEIHSGIKPGFVAAEEKGFCSADQLGCRDGKTMPLIVHLDLKGSPPTLEYLKKFLPFAQSLGATGLLIEYEDTFPYSRRLSSLRSKVFSYSDDDVRQLVGLAHDLHMIVIPLVQTFGHMEFVLKHDEFVSLREEPSNDWSVCPLREGSIELIGDMIDQVMTLHPHSRYLHIGGDEVVNMGRCEQCHDVVRGHGGREELFRRHMLAVMKRVSSRWHSVRSLFWDDMVRKWDVERLKVFADYGEPMAWSYVDNAERVVSPAVLKKFSLAFPHVWLASSFKGSGGESIDWVPVRHHVTNHYSWNKLIQKALPSVDAVGGFVLTGWSRYMHHYPLCELLPAGIPSLALCLNVAAQHETGDLPSSQVAKISSQLGFQQNIPIRNEPHMSDDMAGLSFPGHEAYEIIFRHALLVEEQRQVRLVFNGHDRAKFAEKLSQKAVKLAEDAEVALAKVFPPPVVQEWLRTKLVPILSAVQKKS